MREGGVARPGMPMTGRRHCYIMPGSGCAGPSGPDACSVSPQVSSLSRATSPLLCGSLYSAASAQGDSLLEGLPFYLLCALCVGGLLLSAHLPPRADTKRTGGSPPIGHEVFR